MTRTPDSEVVIEYLDEPIGEIDLIYDTLPSSRLMPQRPRLGAGRLSIDPDAESNVVNEWLTSIAAVASDARKSDPMISAADLSLAPAFPLMAPPPPRKATSVPRLPAVSAPPFLPNGQPYVPSDIVDTLPAPRKRPPSSKAIKTVTPFARTTVTATEPVPERPAMTSVPPTAATLPPVLVKIRPRLSWIAAAAVVGALVAVTVVRLVGSAPPRPVEASAPPPPIETPTAVVATPPAPAPAVVRFSEEEGVVINVAPPAPSPSASIATVHPRPKKPAKPKLEPDPEPKVVVPPPPPLVVAAPAPAPVVRKLTPSQELAEAQLRAASR